MPKSDSTVIEVKKSRGLKEKTSTLLSVLAGGRCQFDGCNKFLFRHHLTNDYGNFSQKAHIVAFSKDGPRGATPINERYINDVQNLMLLCPECHKLIDDAPENYSVEKLKGYKEDHEDRVFRLTEIKNDRKTSVIQFKSRIGGQVVEIPANDIKKALVPRFPKDSKGCVIDLSVLQDSDPNFYESAQRIIDTKIESLLSLGIENENVGHLSAFGLAPIPLLCYLGSRVGNKIPMDVFQRHRDTENWSWKEVGVQVKYIIKKIQEGKDSNKVAVMLSLSGPVNIKALPGTINKSFSIYEITLEGTPLDPTFLNSREDLAAFKRIYRELLSSVMKGHGAIETIHVFPACPAPIAILVGRELLMADPSLVIYNLKTGDTNYKQVFKINDK